MAAEANDSELRKGLHGMWASVAPGWAEHADYVDARSSDITERLLDAAGVGAGMRVLELACGPGSVGIAAAQRVGAEGAVVCSDVAREMTAIAASRAAEQGLSNVTTKVLDLEEIDEPEESYDAVVCREGMMFAANHARAAREIRRVLRPGGRVAVAVWAARERNPWLTILLDAIGEQLGAQVPPPGVPGPFSLSDPRALESLLSEAGWSEVAVDDEPVSVRVEDFDDWWTRTCALAGPVSGLLAALPEEGVEAIRARAAAAIEGYRNGDSIELPGVTLIASGSR
ncbi:MAG TPA: class I SAM-dependent methyltransferase [Solirubrobacteraceae bacterium]|nr:class I SAM-dependent methyltransferase [Solirubrobacteraceae bacterium]